MAVSRYQDEIAILDYLSQALEHRLAGRAHKRIVNRYPADVCHLGVISPWRQARDSESGDGNESGADTRRPPGSLGLEVLVEPNERGLVEFSLTIGFSLFTPRLPSLDETRSQFVRGSSGAPAGSDRRLGTLPLVFERHDVSIELGLGPFHMAEERSRFTDEGQLQAEVDKIVKDYRRAPDAGLRFQPYRPFVREADLVDVASYSAFLTALRGNEVEDLPIEASLDIRAQRDSGDRVRVGIYLRNDTVLGQTRAESNGRILADGSVDAEVVQGRIVPIEILPVPQDYQYDRRVWAVGHNTSVAKVAESDRVISRALALYNQPRRVTRDFEATRFEMLYEDAVGSLTLIRKSMEQYSAQWRSRLKANDLGLTDDEMASAEEDHARFESERDRFSAGVAALLADSDLMESFRATNQVFGRLARGRYDRWHLFQIVFIVSQLPALATRRGLVEADWPEGEHHTWAGELDSVDVLWFPTGGGKTEAYLGLICCAMLYDRLRGKRFGVTAWLRFPLRMLSVQQLQRAIRMVWEAERERSRMFSGPEDDGGDPFSLGYLVGSTPNQLGDEVLDAVEEGRLGEELRLVPNCPNCGGVNTVRVVADKRIKRVRHVCSACDEELPLYVSDEEIYRYVPPLVVGTVDKMATLGFQQKFAMLWGAAKWRCPEHGYGFGRYCVYGCNIPPANRIAVVPIDPSPTFHIQDELHLLQEELGAFAGHYETLVRHCESTLGRDSQPPKALAATATIEGFGHQVRHLYGARRARRFPERGFDRLNSFYSVPDYVQDDNHGSGRAQVKTMRRFLAFRPPSIHQADGASLCARLLHEEMAELARNPDRLPANVISGLSQAELNDLFSNYSTSLTYVGSLRNGTRVQQNLDRDPNVPSLGRDLVTSYVSSKSSMGELAETVRRIEDPPDYSDAGFLDALVATDVISHGVDVERLNLMVMDTFPEEMARYIQASSRSGRRHAGLVVVVLPSYSLRAASVYHRFVEVHEHMERMVAPVPVNRFAKYAVERTGPGVITGLVLGRHNPRTERDLRYRHEVEAWLSGRARDGAGISREELQTDLERAYGLGLGVFPTGLEAALKEALQYQLEAFYYQLAASQERFIKDAVRPRPMTSLRDVEEGVPFRPDSDMAPSTLAWYRSK